MIACIYIYVLHVMSVAGISNIYKCDNYYTNKPQIWSTIYVLMDLNTLTKYSHFSGLYIYIGGVLIERLDIA